MDLVIKNDKSKKKNKNKRKQEITNSNYADMSGLLMEILENFDKNEHCKSLVQQFQNNIITKNDIVLHMKKDIISKYSEIFNISDNGIMGIVSYLIAKMVIDQLKLELKKLEKSNK